MTKANYINLVLLIILEIIIFIVAYIIETSNIILFYKVVSGLILILPSFIIALFICTYIFYFIIKYRNDFIFDNETFDEFVYILQTLLHIDVIERKLGLKTKYPNNFCNTIAPLGTMTMSNEAVESKEISKDAVICSEITTQSINDFYNALNKKLSK